MRRFLKWMFGPSHGVVGTSAPPKVLLKIGKWGMAVNSRPFRSYWPNGPSLQAFWYHKAMHHTLTFFHCKGCGCGCWGYKQRDYCGSWKCYRKVHA